MLLIYSDAVSARCEYVMEVIFARHLGLQYAVTVSLAEFDAHAGEKMSYCDQRLGDEFHITADSLLSEIGITKRDIPVGALQQLPVLYANNGSCDLGFDLFAAAFYMLSRYEEYLPFTPDSHGRFPASESLANKNRFLTIPVVDEWIELFRKSLLKKFPLLATKTSSFSAIATYDIDVAYKFRGRSIIRNTGANIKDLLAGDLKNISARFNTLVKKRKDPWDTYDHLRHIMSSSDFPTIFFFLLGDRSAHNRNLHFKNPVVKDLINTTRSFSEIGIHPSYESGAIPAKIAEEKERLQALSGMNVTKSRQHYLRFHLPGTYRYLLDAGITEDYSMGFSALPGFRAGTSKPFQFYDLEKECMTPLMVFPVTFMEGTFIDVLQVPASEANRQMKELIDAVKKVQGTFISIWHNHTVSETPEYREWKNVHDGLIDYISMSL
jgi:hypothetical protein